jgi:hypothetical protein
VKGQEVKVLGLDCGDRARCDVWEGLLRNRIERGVRADAVELRIMDGLPGLEALFRRLFPRAVGAALPGAREAQRDRPCRKEGPRRALTLNWQWRKYPLSAGKFFHTLKAA